ncbi:MAG: IS200/IS605 family transposase [Planctomycetia bacterium]
MPQSYASVTLHIVFSTKGRKRYLDEKIRNELFSYLGGICNKLRCPSIIVGGHHDHVHIACVLDRTATIAKLVENLKSGSSKWVKTKGPAYEFFAWQTGYSVFSIGRSQRDALIKYIENQEEHHHVKTFQEELEELFRLYKIQYDKKDLEGD